MQVQRPLAAVTPTLDGDVLTALAAAEVSFTPGQVTRLVPEPSPSVEGVRRALQRLTRQGVVTAERVGNAYAYRLNHDHLAAPAIRELARQRATLLERLEDELKAWPVGAVYAALFGSAARGQMRPESESDIDVFLVRPDDADPGRWEAQTGELAATVTRWTGNDTRILEMTEAEVRAGAAAGDPVLRSIVDEGLTISGRPAWLRTLLRGVDA